MISPLPEGSGNPSQEHTVARRGAAGFTLIELMIAMAIFLIIGGAAMSLFKQHASLFNDQQYQIGLNVSLRNALAQIENDVVNAGTGWYNATNNVYELADRCDDQQQRRRRLWVPRCRKPDIQRLCVSTR